MSNIKITKCQWQKFRLPKNQLSKFGLCGAIRMLKYIWLVGWDCGNQVFPLGTRECQQVYHWQMIWTNAQVHYTCINISSFISKRCHVNVFCYVILLLYFTKYRLLCMIALKKWWKLSEVLFCLCFVLGPFLFDDQN